MKKTIVLLTCMIALLFTSCKKEQIESPEVVDQNPTINQTKRTCGKDAHMAKLLQDPVYKARFEKKLEKVNSMVDLRADCSDPIMIPVAIHFQNVSNPDVDCLRNLAQSQVDVLNQDYGGTNSDISSWNGIAASNFPGISNGEACFQFCIATQNHPSGFGISNGDPAVTINKTTGDNNAQWSGYINIFVQPNTGLLGYSPLGGSGNGDGVVVDAAAFGTGNGCGSISPNSPYDLGRTLTHEMGHYLLLDHIWGNGCSSDDGVADTPDSQQEYYGCPSVGAATCGSTDMHMNYMDYTNDACMYMFSEGQVNRSTNYVNSSLQNVLSNAANVCGTTAPPTPTCNDGVQNGSETGVDCGGPDCQPCSTTPTPTCGDGIQNGSETGIDCGGPDCEPCVTTPTPNCTDGIQNGSETGVDCGGPDCTPCQDPVGCVAPTDIQVTNITESTVTISWTAIPDAIKYRLKYRIQGVGNYMPMTVNGTSVTLSGLQADETYQFKIRTKCDGDRSPFSPTQTFTTEAGGGSTGDCDQTEILLNFILDDYGSDITWALEDENYNVLIEGGGNYPDFEAGTEITEAFCLEDGCYSIVVYDLYEDGLCCDYGEGSFELTEGNGDFIIGSDGYYGAYEILDFCVGDGFGEGNVNRVGKRSSTRDAAKIEKARNSKKN